MDRPPAPKNALQEGFIDIDGEGFYAIPHVDRLGPFLMSIVSDSDLWMFVSSRGGLTAGRGSAASALFPYETDDRLHQAAGITGPVTALRLSEGTVWCPFAEPATPDVARNLYKSVVGDQVIFEEVRGGLGLAFRYRWSNSDRFGFVRTATLTNIGKTPVDADLIDGLVNLLPSGLDPALYQRLNNLTNAYKRSEIIDADTRLAAFTLEAHIVDRPEPAEALVGSVAWSSGLEGATVSLDPAAVAKFITGQPRATQSLVTGRPGGYLLAGNVTIDPGLATTWHIVADVRHDQAAVAELRSYLRTTPDPIAAVSASVRRGTERFVHLMARSDALQRTGDRVATAHQFANVTYNAMRGGVFLDGYRVRTSDFAIFVAGRNRAVADRHRTWLESLPEWVERGWLLGEVVDRGEAQLVRLSLEYLPLTFSRRHGDPSRPWNTFSIELHDRDGEPVIYYEGNWRDIFQNWEALCLSFPSYLPSVISVFVNASTADGYNPYRITREGIDWEVPDPDDPWSHIGYWGDHQIVYLHRLLAQAQRFSPETVEDLLARPWFSYADVPYRIASHEELVRDPKNTITYDGAAADRSAERVKEIGADGKLLWGPDREVYLVSLLEKLLVPALAKLSNYVPNGGIWMNTQRPEWNDANNALVGHGLSMVTLYQLRSYLHFLNNLVNDAAMSDIQLSTEVVGWLTRITAILRGHADRPNRDLNPRERKTFMDELGRASFEYRSRVYAGGFSGSTQIGAAAITDLFEVALDHLDTEIRRSRRPDGLYHSYNLVEFGAGGSEATISHLPEMLEGQVAVLSSGLLSAEERAEVVQALFASAMYRPDQRSFMLYPAPRLPSFLDKNVVPDGAVKANPLLNALLAAGDESVVVLDAEGTNRFGAGLRNQSDLRAALDRLSADDAWAGLVADHEAATHDLYEEVFQHHGYTGRSGSMYGFEGIGSIYWHMVAKLLVAVQESVGEAQGANAPPDTIDRLVGDYWRVCAGLGFNKTAAEYGAFPTDPYSHTPAHAGAQQPGMTGQVKEELLTRPLELGVRVTGGEICFDPILLRQGEFLEQPEPWQFIGHDDSATTIDLPAGALGLTVCQVPVIVTLTSGEAFVVVGYVDGTQDRIEGLCVDAATSRAIFDRTGRVARLTAFIPEISVAPTL